MNDVFVDVVLVSLSSGKARKLACDVLDPWLWRQAEQTWSGRISARALELLAAELRGVATRQMSIACYVRPETGGSTDDDPVFIIGSRRPFGENGRVAVTASTIGPKRRRLTSGEKRLLAAVTLAALFHDIGKSCAVFQDKLRAALAKAEPSADPVRHELISALAVDALIELGSSDRDILRVLAEDAASALRQAYASALARIPSLFEIEGRNPLRFRMLNQAESYPFFADVLRLVATHHRLLAAERGVIIPLDHINKAAWDSLEPLGMAAVSLAPYAPLWRHDGWTAAIRKAAANVTDPGPVPNVYAFGRLGLMLGDHHASKIGSRTQTSDPDILVANTGRRDDGLVLAEGLADHLLSVTRHAVEITTTILREQDRFPHVPEDQVPTVLRRPVKSGRFGWQGQGAELIASARSERAKGFFGVVLAGTGTGKTRGCPTLLTAAVGLTLSHSQIEQQADRSSVDDRDCRLRFNLALGLRTLTLQSGSEYVQDIGLLRAHVTVMVGDTASSILHEASKISETVGTDAEPDQMIGSPAEVPRMNDFGSWIRNLGAVGYWDLHDQEIPTAVSEIYASTEKSDEKVRKVLSAPALRPTTAGEAATSLPGRS